MLHRGRQSGRRATCPEIEDRLTLRQAFFESNNRAAVALQQKVWHRPVLRLASSLGVPDQPDVPSLALGTQIDALPPLARRLLRYAAVLGRTFGTEIVDRVLEDEGIALDAASRTALADFIEPAGEDRLQFRHAMVRDVAYEGLSYGLRRTLHLRAGEAVEAVAGGKPDEVADLLSLHYSLGQQHPRAWHYARVAGDDALQNYANVEAATHYERALEAGRRLPDLHGVLQGRR